MYHVFFLALYVDILYVYNIDFEELHSVYFLSLLSFFIKFGRWSILLQKASLFICIIV